MADYEHSTNYHKIVSKIKETNNLKDLETLNRRLGELEQDDEVQELIEKCYEREKEVKELIKEEKYQKVISEYDIDGDNLENQINSFKALNGYKDSENYCETLKKEKEYRELVRLFDSGNCDWEYVSKGFEKLSGFKESKKYHEACQPKTEEQRKEKELREKKKKEVEIEGKYQEAQRAMDDEKHDYASLLFKELGDYKDSKQKAEECDKRIADAKEKERKANEKKKKTIILVLLAVLIVGLASYLIMNLITWQSDENGHWHSVFGFRVSYDDHDYTLITDVAPTCIEDGLKEFKCETCGRTKTETIIPAKGHNYLDGVCLVCSFDSNKYHVGDIGPAGGYVFYDCDADNDYGNSDGLKSSECGWRFLEAAYTDVEQGSEDYFMWGDYGILGTQTGIGTGKTNTAIIVSKASKTRNPNAATLCNDYTYGGCDNWFLPSKDELNLMYNNLDNKGHGGFAYDFYWSSSENSNGTDNAWRQLFSNGYQSYDYRYDDLRVRPVRAF